MLEVLHSIQFAEGFAAGGLTAVLAAVIYAHRGAIAKVFKSAEAKVGAEFASLHTALANVEGKMVSGFTATSSAVKGVQTAVTDLHTRLTKVESAVFGGQAGAAAPAAPAPETPAH